MEKTIKIVTERGTSSRVISYNSSIWTGPEFHNAQMKKMLSLPKNTLLSCGKGTMVVMASSVMHTPRIRSTKGMRISTGKGTGISYL